MRKITYLGLMILAVVANSATADDADDAHYVSHGPLRSDQYYWVRSDSVDSEYDSELQDQAIDDLVFCRGLQEEEFGDRKVMNPTAEHNVRICMIKRLWGIKEYPVRQ